MTRDELEETYTKLCDRLSEVGEANTGIALARLTMLLIQNMSDANRVSALIDEAVVGYTGESKPVEEGSSL